MAATVQTVERTSESPHLRVGERLRDLVGHREILLNLVRKELKVKYAASVLGAVWSLLNPLVFLAVFSFVVRVFGNPIPNFPVYLLSGLLAWNLVSNSLQSCTRSVIDNGNLVKKVAFPREILPLASIGVALVDFVLQVTVLLLVVLVSGFGFHWPEIALFPLVVVTMLAFTTAVGVWVAALNVRYRDVGHLLNIALLVWFWGTPIVYAAGAVQDQLAGDHPFWWAVFLLNPLVTIIGGMQRALYATVFPEGQHVLIDVGLGQLALALTLVLVLSLAALRVTWGYYFTRSGDFAEEL
jgi:ABC-2 type transport system permease protein